MHDAMEPMARDARTAWAWHVYQRLRPQRLLSPQAVEQLHGRIEDDDVVEFLSDAVVVEGGHALRLAKLPRPDSPEWLVARTLRKWVLLNLIVPTSSVEISERKRPGTVVFNHKMHMEREAGITVGGYAVKMFLGDRRIVAVDHWIRHGAGAEILRIPDLPDVPTPPVLGETPRDQPESAADWRPRRVTTWMSTEEVAMNHMRQLGFATATVTPPGRDGGVDVVAKGAVAQVKHQGVPVGAPAVQQLKGARSDVDNWLFYSTSDYTSAALIAAREGGVALFTVDSDSRVRTRNLLAEHLVAQSSGPDSDEAAVVAYVDGVKSRVATALSSINADPVAPEGIARFGSYLRRSAELLQDGPGFDTSPLRSVVNHYRHAELLVAVATRELGRPYPEPAGKDGSVKSLDDFYA